MRKEKFVPGEYYHIYSRTIFNIPEFEDYSNARKLAQTFLLANSTESTKAFDYLRTFDNATLPKSIEIAWRGDKLVDVVCYAIMPDHYHLLVKELRENGVSDFIRKCNISIAKYINTKKQRKGSLFESRFKSKHVDSNEYLLHLSLYIHLNPLDFIDGRSWRKGGLKNWKTKKKELLKYPWSSLRGFWDDDFDDLIISGSEIISKQFKRKGGYEKFLREWSEGDMDKINDIMID